MKCACCKNEIVRRDADRLNCLILQRFKFEFHQPWDAREESVINVFSKGDYPSAGGKPRGLIRFHKKAGRHFFYPNGTRRSKRSRNFDCMALMELAQAIHFLDARCNNVDK